MYALLVTIIASTVILPIFASIGYFISGIAVKLLIRKEALHG